MTKEQIAIVCHEANATLCRTQGDRSQTQWPYAPEWQQQSAIKGVEFCLANPSASVSAIHDAWLIQKSIDGWKYGSILDATKKEHPCFVSADQRTPEQKVKDHLSRAIVGALSPFLTE